MNEVFEAKNPRKASTQLVRVNKKTVLDEKGEKHAEILVV